MIRRQTVRFYHIPLAFLCVFNLTPILLLLLNSLKTETEIRITPLAFPGALQWENYVEAWRIGNFTLGLANSLLVTALAILLVGLLATMIAFSLTKLEMAGGDIVLMVFLLGMTLPPQLFLIPLFFTWHRIGLVNSRIGLVLIYVARFMPFCVFLSRAYYLGIPAGIEDSAKVDGCSDLQLYTRIMLPLSAPIMTTIAAVVGMWTWNEFLFATTFLHKEEVRNMAIRYYYFTSRAHTSIAYIAASGVMMIVPMILLYVMLQRKFIEGMTKGSVKG